MKKAIRKAMMILAGVSMILAAGSAMADEMVNIGGAMISKSDYQGIRAMVAGQPSGGRVYAKKAEAVKVGPMEVAKSDYDKIKDIVAGKASVGDALVYARAHEVVNVGPVAVSKEEFLAVKDRVSNGPVVRFAQHLNKASDVN